MMKRVLMVSCEGLGRGGVQSVMMSIVRNLHNEFYFDMLLFTNETRYYENEFLSYGGKIFRISRYCGKSTIRKKIDYYVRGKRLYRNVIKILKSGRYDVVHCNNGFESAVILKAAKKLNVPVRISHVHTIEHKNNCIAEMLHFKRRNMIEKYSTVKVGCSSEACISFFKKANDAKIILNPYDEKKFFICEDQNRTTFDSVNLIQIGSFSENKNQIFSLNILKSLKKHFPQATLSLVGFDIGNYQSKINDVIEKLKLENSVTFYPSDADTAKILGKSEVLLFPSLHEGFGIVLIEAQAMGVKCYASDTVPKSTNCGGVDFLPLCDGAEKWALKIADDIKNRKTVHTKYDCSKFTVQKISEEYKKIYDGGKQ